MSKWCGYIDLLGTRELASRDPQELITSLDSLHSALADNFSEFRNAKCTAFSDGAFFVTDSYKNFHPFFSKLRNQLYQAGLFFRCSYLPGDIPSFDRETDESGRYISPKPPAFRSFTFSGSAPDAYSRESNFKGVGCIVDGSAQYIDGESNIPNFFVTFDGAKIVLKEFRDIPFSAFEISDPDDDFPDQNYAGEQLILDQIFYACHAALAQSEKIGSYFLPVFVNAIRSSDFSKISIHDGKWMDAPYIFRKIFSSTAIKSIKDIPGLNFIFLAAFNHLHKAFDENIDGKVEGRVLMKMMQRPGCFKNLDRVPPYVISPKAKLRLIQLKASAEDVSPGRTRRPKGA